MRKISTILAVSAAMVLACATTASADTMLGMGRAFHSTTSTLLQITPSPFSISTIGSTTAGPLSGLAYDRMNGVLYAASGHTGVVGVNSFFSVNPSTGAATLIGGLGGNVESTDIGIGNDGTVYSTNFDNLYTINTTTGLASLVGSFQNSTSLEAIAVDPTTGILYGLNYDDGNYYSIDTSTGLATLLGSYGNAFSDNSGNWSGLGIDSAGNVFASLGAGSGNIYQLNSDFSTTLLGSYGNSVSDVTFIPSTVPEPATIALVGVGLLGLGFSRRKRAS